MNTTISHELFTRAKAVIPGGVNSPVRAFRSVGLEPLFIRSANGPVILDVDGNVLIDYVASWGPMILGHNDPDIAEAVRQAIGNGLSYGAPCQGEVEIAEFITSIAPVEMLRMVNSGTEAVMGAVRAARGFTGRDKLIKFAGCYHGHADHMLVKAGSGLLTGGIADSAGVPAGVARDTLTANYNDLAGVEKLLVENKNQVAAIIVEPVAANMGVVIPEPDFLPGLRNLCNQHRALLIFDEVITGFRLALGGAQEFFRVKADLVTYGKIIGGGLPVGAYGGRRDVMSTVAPLGPVYQAGTLSGNPVAMAAGLAQLKKLSRDPGIYARLAENTQRLAAGLKAAAGASGGKVQVNQIGSLCSAFFADRPVKDYDTAKRSDTALYARFFAGMLEQGVYLAPSQFEAMFVSASHTPQHIADTLAAAKTALERG